MIWNVAHFPERYVFFVWEDRVRKTCIRESIREAFGFDRIISRVGDALQHFLFFFPPGVNSATAKATAIRSVSLFRRDIRERKRTLTILAFVRQHGEACIRIARPLSASKMIFAELRKTVLDSAEHCEIPQVQCIRGSSLSLFFFVLIK